MLLVLRSSVANAQERPQRRPSSAAFVYGSSVASTSTRDSRRLPSPLRSPVTRMMSRNSRGISTSGLARMARAMRPLGAEAQVAERLHHLGGVGRDHRVHELRVAQAELVVQLAAEAEVQHHELRAGPDEEVAGVRIGVEHAVRAQLLPGGGCTPAGDGA